MPPADAAHVRVPRGVSRWPARAGLGVAAGALLLAPLGGAAQSTPGQDPSARDTTGGGAPRGAPGAPNSWLSNHWPVAALTLAGTAATDPWLRDALRGPGPPVLRTTARAVEPLGRSRTALVGLGGTFLVSELGGRPAWARATVRVAAGYLAGDAVTAVLKPVVGRSRPYVGRGAYHFHVFAGGDDEHSFPSGHATHAFALAAGIAAEAHRPWVTATAYGTAALVGWSRVHDDAHWTSDVVAGALVGATASAVTRRWLGRWIRHGRPAADSSRIAGVPTARVLPAPRGVTLALTF